MPSPSRTAARARLERVAVVVPEAILEIGEARRRRRSPSIDDASLLVERVPDDRVAHHRDVEDRSASSSRKRSWRSTPTRAPLSGW